MSAFAVGEFAVVENLQKTPEYNGKLGVVKSETPEGDRREVRMFEADKLIRVKVTNLRAPKDEDFTSQLTEAFEKLSKEQIEEILTAADQQVKPEWDKDDLVRMAVTARAVPEVAKRSESDMIDVPGMGRMSRREMREHASRLDNMSSTQMREQLRVLTSYPPNELRSKFPQFRSMSDEMIQAQIKQYQYFVENPRVKKAQIEALRTGDFSKLQREMTSTMSDTELRDNIQKQLDAFRKDPKAYRKQVPDLDGLSDKEVEEMLETQLKADPAQLRAAAKGQMGGGPGGMDLSGLSEDQFKKQAEMQLKLFKANPRRFRETMEKQNPEMKNLSDDQILTQLEMMMSMSKKDLEDMNKYAQTLKDPSQSSSDPSAVAGVPNINFDNMSGDQIQRMMKAQLDMFNRDPVKFKKTVPQFAGMKDEDIRSQLQMMADLDPTYLKMFLSVQSKYGWIINKVKEPLDRITFGNGQRAIGVLMLIVAVLVVYFLTFAIIRLLGFIFPTFRGLTGSSTGAAQFAAPQQQHAAPQQVEVNVEVEEDAFFQTNEDL